MKAQLAKAAVGLLAAALFQCATAQPVVVELFTSQGCSSCPPADALLAELAKRPNILALAYHVDYFDDTSWKDPFSLAAATQRQRGYVRRLARSGPFTPQAIISGDTSILGSNRAAMKDALAGDRDALDMAISKTGGELLIQLRERWRESMDVYAVSYRASATTQIKGGENARRSAKDVNIVRSVQRVARWNGVPQRMNFDIAKFPGDATHVAVLLQRTNQGAIAAAASIALR